MAQNYPTDPSAQAVEACAHFINALPWMLPSELAGYTLGAFIQVKAISQQIESIAMPSG